MKAYGICFSNTLENLVDEVNQRIEDGYAPAGGPFKTGIPTRPLAQALFKKPVKTVKKQAARNEYPQEFEEVWKIYPKRAGQNPKKKAYHAWNARTEESLVLDIWNGVKAYADYIKATNTEPKYVMMAATFFGPDKHYENDWEIPEASKSLPKRDNDLVAYAQKHDLPMPNIGEEMWAYRARLEQTT